MQLVVGGWVDQMTEVTRGELVQLKLQLPLPNRSSPVPETANTGVIVTETLQALISLVLPSLDDLW